MDSSLFEGGGSEELTEGVIWQQKYPHGRSKNMSLDYNKNLIPCAKELRRDMTKQEKHLWYDFLSKYPMRFQRQKTIDNFIVDFYCFKARLVVEVDGSQHYADKGQVYDTKRTAILEGFGLKVLRFTNNNIDKNFVEVCAAIDLEVKERTPPVTA